MPFITQLMCLLVDQNLRSLEAFGCTCLHIETIHWLPMTTICIFTYNCWAPTHCQCVITLSVNGTSTIFRLTSSPNKRLHSHILPKWSYWRFSLAKRILTCSLTNPGNEHQRCVNNVSSYESDNQTEDMVAVTHNPSIGRIKGRKC